MGYIEDAVKRFGTNPYPDDATRRAGDAFVQVIRINLTKRARMTYGRLVLDTGTSTTPSDVQEAWVAAVTIAGERPRAALVPFELLPPSERWLVERYARAICAVARSEF